MYPWIQFPNKVLARVLRGEIGGYTFNFLNFQAKNVCIGRYITECWYVLYIYIVYYNKLLVAIVVIAAMVSQRNFCLTVGQKLVAEHQ